MSRPTRRMVLGGLGGLGGLAAATTVGWPSLARAARAPADEPATVDVSARRIRPGAQIGLRCPAADAFRFSFGERTPRTVSAPDGRLTVGAPAGWGRVAWTPLQIVPLRGDRPIGPAAEVLVFTRPPIFGA